LADGIKRPGKFAGREAADLNAIPEPKMQLLPMKDLHPRMFGAQKVQGLQSTEQGCFRLPRPGGITRI
jgi:hypothetical protein